jgi:hypothetical protein
MMPAVIPVNDGTGDCDQLRIRWSRVQGVDAGLPRREMVSSLFVGVVAIVFFSFPQAARVI